MPRGTAGSIQAVILEDHGHRYRKRAPARWHTFKGRVYTEKEIFQCTHCDSWIRAKEDQWKVATFCPAAQGMVFPAVGTKRYGFRAKNMLRRS